jgi:2,4-didehydro-3-deoxy-L-rhamnonate hydrolase
MRLATILVSGRERVVGALGGNRLVDLAGISERYSIGPVGFPDDMVDLIRSGWLGMEFLKQVEKVATQETGCGDLCYDEDGVLWKAPIPRPRQMPFVFANSDDNASVVAERLNPNSGGRWPRPLYFLKAPSSIIGNGETLVLYEDMGLVTPEAELGLIIGRKAKRVRPENALDVIFGFSLCNDITSGGLSQQDGVKFTARDGDKIEYFYSRPMARYKGADTFGPFGPFITPKEEIGAVDKITISARFNGVLVEQGSVADYKFSIGEVIATITELITLEPGDVVSMGTMPAVPGKTIRSANLLKGGTIELESPEIGLLRNSIKVLPPLWPDYPAVRAPELR